MKIDGIKYFELEELVDKPYIDQFGEKAIWFINFALVQDIDRLRDNVGKILINDWHVGGHFFESGVRILKTLTGAQYSQHKMGRAFDLKPQEVSVTDLYQHIMNNQVNYLNIRAIENPLATKTWLHVDSRWTGQHNILIVDP